MANATPSTVREAQLRGQTVVLIGGSAGIGLDTARQARAEGADVVLVGRDPDRLQHAAAEVDARSTAAFDAADPEHLERFFAELPGPIDHVMVTAGGNYYARLADLDFRQARRLVDDHLWLPLHLARAAIGKVRSGGTLLFMGGVEIRPGLGLALPGALTAALPTLIANLALELAPVRVNLIAAGFVDTALSARLLGDDLEQRREEFARHPPDQARRRTGRRAAGCGPPLRRSRTTDRPPLTARRAAPRHTRGAAPMRQARWQHGSIGS